METKWKPNQVVSYNSWCGEGITIQYDNKEQVEEVLNNN